MEILSASSKPPITTYLKKETVFDLSGRKISVLKKDDFNGYNGEKTLDLSRNCFHYIPKWISELPITKLVVSHGTPKFGLSFAAGFRQDIVIEAYGMGLKHPPKNLNHAKVRCEVDFKAHEYWEQFPQKGFLAL